MGDVGELEVSLDHANAANIETQKVIKRYHQQIRDVQVKLEEEQRAKEVCRDQFIAADRRAHSMQNALEEARTLLEQADRALVHVNKNYLTPMNNFLNLLAKTKPLQELKENWRLKCRPSMEILMR